MAAIFSSVTPFPESIMENYRWLDELLLGQAATQKEFNPGWQAYKYLLGGKMYAYIGVYDPNARPIITLKLEPIFSDMLRREYNDIVPGYYMSKLHWSTVFLDGGVPQEVLRDMVQAAYKLVLSSLSKKMQQEIQERATYKEK